VCAWNPSEYVSFHRHYHCSYYHPRHSPIVVSAWGPTGICKFSSVLLSL
jgi:hypothetical protein